MFITNATLSLSQTETLSGDSVRALDFQEPQTFNPNDTLSADSLLVNPSDTIPQKKEVLESKVIYTAQDSIIFTKDNKGYLYGEADVKYQDIAIKGELITMDMDSSTIGATFGLDSIGKEFGYPTFEDKGTQYEMKGVKYNFKTEKAYLFIFANSTKRK